jgi:hypothetical protein
MFLSVALILRHGLRREREAAVVECTGEHALAEGLHTTEAATHQPPKRRLR